jgi:hypothetical protein
MDGPYHYPIVRWTSAEVVAREDAHSFGCSTDTITLSRRSQTGLWVREPANVTNPFCKDADTKVRKWTIENSLGYRKLYGR